MIIRKLKATMWFKRLGNWFLQHPLLKSTRCFSINSIFLWFLLSSSWCDRLIMNVFDSTDISIADKYNETVMVIEDGDATIVQFDKTRVSLPIVYGTFKIVKH